MKLMIKMPFGWRLWKTGIAIFLCIIMCRWLNIDSPMLPCLAAVYSMRQDMNQSLKFGLIRISGVILSAIVAVLFLTIFDFVTPADWMIATIIPLAIVCYIYIAYRWHLDLGVVTGCATMFIIFFDVPSENQIIYAITRAGLTIMGVIIALVVNRVLPNHHLRKDA